jgi:hypothetical protein
VTKASVCSLVLPLSPLFLRSQISDNISLVGTVADKTGSVASGAKVTAGEQSTRVRDSAVTGTAGHYAITFIQSGTYDITVEQAGFSKVRTTGVAVRTDLTLAAGSTAGTVTVSAGTPPISTDAASLGETFTPKQVEGLPSKVITRSRLRLWHPTSPLGKGDVPIPRAEAFKVTNRPSAANPNGALRLSTQRLNRVRHLTPVPPTSSGWRPPCRPLPGELSGARSLQLSGRFVV